MNAKYYKMVLERIQEYIDCHDEHEQKVRECTICMGKEFDWEDVAQDLQNNYEASKNKPWEVPDLQEWKHEEKYQEIKKFVDELPLEKDTDTVDIAMDIQARILSWMPEEYDC